MNLSLAFLHGEQALVGFVLAAVTVLVGFPLLVYVWLRHTKLSEKKLALAYFSNCQRVWCVRSQRFDVSSSLYPVLYCLHFYHALELNHDFCAVLAWQPVYER